MYNNIFLDIDCGTIEAPENGAVSVISTTYNSRANYSCNEGYILIGNESVTCLASGMWSNSTSTECVREYYFN